MRAYFELVRPANVVTALADVLAGCAIVGAWDGGALPWLLGSTACLYAGGVVLNDVFDRRIDALERPERPIPSGRVSAGIGAALGATLLVAGVTFASQATIAAAGVAGAIAGLVVAYDAWAKRHGVAGPLAMGGCRGLNLLLGMAAAPAAMAARWPLMLLPFVYIVAVTVVSRGEVHGGRAMTGGVAFAAVAGIVAALMGLAAAGGPAAWGLVIAGLLAWRVLPPFWRAWRDPQPALLRHAVRAGVLSLIFLDASLAATYAGGLYGLAVLGLVPVAYGLSRLFAVT